MSYEMRVEPLYSDDDDEVLLMGDQLSMLCQSCRFLTTLPYPNSIFYKFSIYWKCSRTPKEWCQHHTMGGILYMYNNKPALLHFLFPDVCYFVVSHAKFVLDLNY